MELSKNRAILGLVAAQTGLDETFRHIIENTLYECDHVENARSRRHASRASRVNNKQRPVHPRSVMKYSRQKH